jgi:hypothetical protein
MRFNSRTSCKETEKFTRHPLQRDKEMKTYIREDARVDFSFTTGS